MSTNMTLIETKTVGSGGSSNIEFTGLGTYSSIYTDLKLVVSGRNSTDSTGLRISFNGSSSSYSQIRLYGAGSGSPASDTGFTTYISSTGINDSTFTANTFGNCEIYIPNYSSSNYKSISVDGVTENNATTSYAMFTSGLWSNVDPITTITLVASGGNFVQHSTASLYGISKVTSTPKATGGIVSQDASYWYHTFPFTSTFTPTQALSADILCIAGGGGGGARRGGGGGAGGLVYLTSQSLTTTGYTVTVGAGGGGGIDGSNPNGGPGQNSQFGALTAAVGGGRATGDGSSGDKDGGSGGGSTSILAGGTATSGQGNNGGAGSGAGPNYGAGGGGGAGAAGTAGTSTVGGKGGDGVNTYASWANATFTGANGYYAGGGGGAVYDGGTAGLGGLGGGANAGAGGGNNAGAVGVINTGGGGGGSSILSSGNAVAGAGGSGLVIVRYAK